MSTPGVPGGALPFSGPLDLAKINAEWGLGTDLTQYHGVRWYYDGNLTTGLFGGNTIKVSDFYGKRATDPAGLGLYFSNTAGSGSTVIPLYRNSITIEIWGGGGGGGGAYAGSVGSGPDATANGGNGGDSTVLGVTSGGGQGGGGGYLYDGISPPANPSTTDNGGRYYTVVTDNGDGTLTSTTFSKDTVVNQQVTNSITGEKVE
jgi:hypothetical protein